MNIVITGVTRGLGRALAEWFIGHGHVVAGCGRDGKEIFDLRFTYPEPHDFAAVDVTQPTRVAIWSENVLGRMGAPDLLINNAAVINDPAPLWEVPGEKFAQLIAINITGVANVIRCFVPAMVAAQKGVIVNLSSGWGRSVSKGVAPYCASKWAIEGLTKALAEELPAGMAAVPLSPGTIDTAMLRRCWADGAADFPKPETWVETAAPYILQLGPKDNGRSLSVGGAAD
jgi:NAD(P)-dependent dehydrogenase (short-subunit alcohol dehydrogenase family)